MLTFQIGPVILRSKALMCIGKSVLIGGVHMCGVITFDTSTVFVRNVQNLNIVLLFPRRDHNICYRTPDQHSPGSSPQSGLPSAG